MQPEDQYDALSLTDSLLSPLSNSPLDFDWATFPPHMYSASMPNKHNTGLYANNPPNNFLQPGPNQTFVHQNNFQTLHQNMLQGPSVIQFAHNIQQNSPLGNSPSVGTGGTEEKRRKRRESHNAVERRRRDNINDRIAELSTMLPEFADDANAQNKGVVLRRSVEYIRHLQVYAARQADRTVELEQVLMRVCAMNGIAEHTLMLSQPLGTHIEITPVAQNVAEDL